jgi:flagellar motor protein MotB
MAKGGGAWKVAYADFVTAMMAFFLVMWICAQDQKTKKAVADYFSNPNGVSTKGSTTPMKTGSMHEGVNTGSTPESEQVTMTRGRGTHTSQAKVSRVTKLVNVWLHSESQIMEYWRKKASVQRELARKELGPDCKTEHLDNHAKQQLSLLLNEELTRDIPAKAKGLHRDLLVEIMADVNWAELAEDLLSR